MKTRDLQTWLHLAARNVWPLSLILKREDENLRDMFEHTGLTGVFRSLEIGCGTGRVARLLRLPSPAVGLDRSLDLVRRTGSAAVVGDAFHLPLRSGSIDLLLSVGVSEYARDIEGLVNEMAAVSNRGAILLLTSAPPTLFSRLRHLLDSRIRARAPEQVLAIAERYGFSQRERRHTSSQDLYLLVKR